MTDLSYKQAAARLKKIARHEYAVIQLKQQFNLSKEIKQEYIVYLSGYGHFTGNNWKTALNDLEKAVTARRNQNILPPPQTAGAWT